MIGRRAPIIASFILLAGCAGTQLKNNTIDIASTVTAIHTAQVLDNLGRFIDEPYALPSQIDIQSGIIQTSDTITPTVTTPLSRSSTRGAGGALTGLATAGAGFTMTGTDGWLQSWTVTPISDSAALTNIMELYHYIIYGETKTSLGSLSAAITSLPPRRIFWNGYAANGSVNPPPAGVDLVDLGNHGNHELYITREDFNEGYLSRLVLLVLPPPAAPAAAAPSAPTKGAKKGGRTGQSRTPAPRFRVDSVRPPGSAPSILIVPRTLNEPPK
jgi:hypothetical protein